jgi:hypothetical protein
VRVVGKGAAGIVGALVAIAVVSSPSGASQGRRGDAPPTDTTPTVTTTTTPTTPTTTTPTTTTTPPPAPPSITVHASPGVILSGTFVTLSGEVGGAPAGSAVQLYKSPYPYPVAKLVRTTVTGASGSYSFTVFPDRDVRYRVTLAGTSASAEVQIPVMGRTTTSVQALPLGQARVTILVYHPSDLPWGGKKVGWTFATGYRDRFIPAPPTRTERLSRYVVKLTTTITLPAGHFRWRACFHGKNDHAFLNPRRPPGCTGLGYNGSGSLPVGFPGPPAVARAASYLGSRAGRTAFAVVDSEGRMSGVNEHWTFVSASVVKAMLLVAYLRRLDAMGQHIVDSYSNSFLYPMINVSDNSAATTTWSIVGDSGLYSVAGAAGMSDFSIVGIWANAQISAADQAKFFFEMDSLIPREFVGYARFLLSTIAGYESWGIPAIARGQGYAVFFKGGWRGTGLGQLVHQVARLEGHGRTFSIAVMTDGDPSMGYGIDTIQGVTASLL